MTERARFYALRGLEEVTALDVREGNVIYTEGYRCRVSDVSIVADPYRFGEFVARYTLTSEPDAEHPRTLPPGYEGMRSGGNHRATVLRHIENPRPSSWRRVTVPQDEREFVAEYWNVPPGTH
jgi:hypothetical protein